MKKSIMVLSFTVLAATTASWAAPKPKSLVHHDRASRLSTHASKMGATRTVGQYMRGMTVTTSNAFTVRGAVDGSDLLVSLPSMNEDLTLLKQHQKFDQKVDVPAGLYGEKLYPNHTLLALSGAVQANVAGGRKLDGYDDITTASPDITVKGTKSFSDLSIPVAKLDLSAFVNPWVTGFIELGKMPPTNRFSLQINRAWLTIGNLAKAPVYMSAGQMFVPFGKYSSAQLTDPITKTMFQVKDPTILLGAAKGDFSAQAYMFQDQTNIYFEQKHEDQLNDGGVNLTMDHAFSGGRLDGAKLSMGAGWISNIQSAGGMGNVNELKTTSGKEVKRVGAYDVHMEDSIPFHSGTIGGSAEFISTIEKFNPGNLSFDGKAAQPKALHVELDINNHFRAFPVGVFVGYDHSWQAAGLNNNGAPGNQRPSAGGSNLYTDYTMVPKQAITGGVSASIWHSTLLSIEYQYAMGYKKSGSYNDDNGKNIIVNQGGKNANIVTAALALYF